MNKRRILVIAGSDSSGGAGLEADQRVIAAHKCYAMTATTALTAQNTLGVYNIHHVPSEMVRQQIDACIDDIGVDVVKVGMLASAETTAAVADALESHGRPIAIVDPVMVSTSGSQLLSQDALSTIRRRILPLTTILTPNIPEARMLLEDGGIKASDPQKGNSRLALLQIARALRNLGPKYVLLKGGHLPLQANLEKPSEDPSTAVVLDILQTENDVMIRQMRYHDSKNTHGTGCSLASAIASNIASGKGIEDAVSAAIHYVATGVQTAPDLGQGNGPINHLQWTSFEHPSGDVEGLRIERLPNQDDASVQDGQLHPQATTFH